MFDAGSRPIGRLFYWCMALVMIVGSRSNVAGAAPVPQSGLASTTIADTVYTADGTIAEGTLIITWPAFVTASGAAVAGGTTNVTLGTNGALSVALVPNAGATPAGVYYTVVYQLGPAVAAREIIDPPKFRSGVSKIIDGTVDCLNASTWAKPQTQQPTVNPQP